MLLQQILAKIHQRNTSLRFSIQNVCYCSKSFLKHIRGMGRLHQDFECKMYTTASNKVLKTSKEYSTEILNAKCMLLHQILLKTHPRNTSSRFRMRNVCYCSKSFLKFTRGIHHGYFEREMYATEANPSQNTPEEYITKILNSRCMLLQQVLAKTHPRNTSSRFWMRNVCYGSKSFLKYTRGIHH